MRKNRLSDYTDIEIENILDNSVSFSDVLRKFGYNSLTTSNYKIVKVELKRREIEIPIYKYSQIPEQVYFNRKKTTNELLVNNSTFSRHSLKKRIISENLIEYKCEECENDGAWNGKKLVLQLEHKNGDTYDNRLENLCFLCPNCHSQTNTFSGKNSKRIKKEIEIKKCECGKNIAHTSFMCVHCYTKGNRIMERPSYENLKNEINETSQNKVAKKYGVSWRTIRKWLKYYEKNEIQTGLEPVTKEFRIPYSTN